VEPAVFILGVKTERLKAINTNTTGCTYRITDTGGIRKWSTHRQVAKLFLAVLATSNHATAAWVTFHAIAALWACRLVLLVRIFGISVV